MKKRVKKILRTAQKKVRLSGWSATRFGRRVLLGIEDVPPTKNDGRPKCWVVVWPVSGTTGMLLAGADAEDHPPSTTSVAGRVGLLLRVDDFDTDYARMVDAGVVFIMPPLTEPFGKVAVFVDIAGNRWDLLGPRIDGAP